MDLRETILQEHSKRQMQKIVRWVGNDPKRFSALVKLFLHGEYRVTQRAAWPISYCIEAHPELARPWLKKMLLKTKEPGVHDAVKRNVLRLLQEVNIPKSLQGLTAKISFDFLQDAREPIAVRVFSMSVLANIAPNEPGLKNELRLVVEDMMPLESAAIQARGRKILKQLKSPV